ncbi:peptidase M15 [Paludibacter sp. 221]|uniref:D-Ala-D-Ala carboxypeptidase family metallohydrolase n=1 Tax=Paludibacter sp. 221 TaxID=2302939 RepID=UPI0013D3846B|nr:D-Ala-D-Ala carboxypeptidase family metallohydrolase [Paludibacter sp. 221]NDV46269.1 peptidase M15 [Paludibacter sp. 221]
MITSKYFKEVEFQQLTPSCSLQDMKQSTMSKLDTAREIAGIPFVLTCAYRSVEWDKSKGRSGTGAHTLGQAVDIRCNSDANRWKIVNALIRAGFKRIGIAKSFIHADDSEQHTQEIIWMY